MDGTGCIRSNCPNPTGAGIVTAGDSACQWESKYFDTTLSVDDCKAKCLGDPQCTGVYIKERECVCDDTCFKAKDGNCDDGSPGTTWEKQHPSSIPCQRGTDCSDCGSSNGGGSCSNECKCTDTCKYARDGECGDGRPLVYDGKLDRAWWDIGAEIGANCARGTDCADCGPDIAWLPTLKQHQGVGKWVRQGTPHVGDTMSAAELEKFNKIDRGAQCPAPGVGPRSSRGRASSQKLRKL